MNIKKQFKITSRYLLYLAISLQVSFGSVPMILAAESTNGKNAADKMAASASQPGMREHIATWSQGADAIAKGDLRGLPDYDPNFFQIGDQYIEINNRVYSLNNNQVVLPEVAFTGLKVFYSEERKEIVFQGLRGQNDRGEAGQVVAAQVISGIEVDEMIQDEEFVVIIDKQRNVHAIPMDYVVKNVFKSPLPVFKNLATVPANFRNEKLKIYFDSPGVRVPDFDPNDPDVLVMRDEKGNPILDTDSGDLIVVADVNGRKNLKAVLSRQVMYEQVIRGFRSLIGMAIQVYPANLRQSTIQNWADALESMEAHQKPYTLADMPELTARALINFREAEVQHMNESMKQQNDRATQRQYHRNYYSERQKLYAQLEEVARARVAEIDGELSVSGIDPSKADDLTFEKNQIIQMLQDGDFTLRWQEFYKSSAAMPIRIHKIQQKQKSWIKKAAGFSLMYLAPYFATGALVGLPIAYEASETAQQVHALSWMYQHLLPDVVKNAEYRHYLFVSTMALLSIPPAVEAISWSMGRSLRGLAAVLKNSTKRVAQVIRDTAKVWAPLENWQRNATAGMRALSSLAVSILRAPMYMMLQPTMVTAINSGVNPFRTITPNSNIGQQVGATENFRIGLLSPFLVGQKRAEQKELQARAQNIINGRKKHIESLSWQIAAVAVAEQAGVDPATIHLLAAGRIKPEELDKIFADQKLKDDWMSTQETVETYLRGLGEGYFQQDVKEITAEMQDRHMAIAQEIVRRVKNQSKMQNAAKKLWRISRNSLALTADTLMNWGQADRKFLATVIASRQTGQMTKQSYIPDHIMVCLIIAFFGDRANLDDPSALAASKDGLAHTNAPHWSDVTENANVHWLIAASRRALLFQQIKPVDSNRYLPAEHMWADALHRPEPFTKASFEWLANVIDPRISNIGHYAVKQFVKRLTTIQAIFIISMTMRMTLGEQTFGNAFMGFAIFLFAAQWFYRWVWDFIDRGNDLENKRIADQRAEFDAAVTLISQGATEGNNRGQEKIREGYQRLVKLFEEHNPDALAQIRQALDEKNQGELAKEYQDLYDPKSMEGLGALARLAMALESDKQNEIDRAAGDVRETLENGGLMTEEVEKMNATALMAYAFTNSPIFTQKHGATSWLSNIVFGAVGTTLLAIPLSVMSFKPDFLTWQTLLKWMAISGVGFPLYNYALTDKGWVAQALNKIDHWKLERAAKAQLACEPDLKTRTKN